MFANGCGFVVEFLRINNLNKTISMNAKEFLKQSGHIDDCHSSVNYIAKMMEEYAEMQVKTCNKPAVSGALPYDAPDEIWVNVYNPIKPNSWDIHDSEKSAVMNSIGAKTHRYIHERLLGNDR